MLPYVKLTSAMRSPTANNSTSVSGSSAMRTGDLIQYPRWLFLGESDPSTALSSPEWLIFRATISGFLLETMLLRSLVSPSIPVLLGTSMRNIWHPSLHLMALTQLMRLEPRVAPPTSFDTSFIFLLGEEALKVGLLALTGVDLCVCLVRAILVFVSSSSNELYNLENRQVFYKYEIQLASSLRGVSTEFTRVIMPQYGHLQETTRQQYGHHFCKTLIPNIVLRCT
jgi:hypothetical protein